MAKKERSSPFNKRLPLLLIASLLLGGGWWIWESDTWASWKEHLLEYVENQDIATLEARFSAEQIIEKNRQELLGTDKRPLQNTTLKYYPYLLLDVKYSDGDLTREGAMLWGLYDGEMVISTESWDLTHGFRDCLECQATRSDFKILQALSKRHGSLSLDELQKEIRIERDLLNAWIEGAKYKHLIVQKGNFVHLHFENPKLSVSPQTKIKHHLVSRPVGEGEKMPKVYGRHQIIDIIHAAFGNECKVRREQEIFLPVYSLEVLNPDGSIQISDWNALTGQRIIPRYFTH